MLAEEGEGEEDESDGLFRDDIESEDFRAEVWRKRINRDGGRREADGDAGGGGMDMDSR